MNDKRRQIGGIGLAVAGLLALWWINAPMPLDHVAKVHDLAQKFDDTVFNNDRGQVSTHLIRWPRGRIRIYPYTSMPNNLGASLTIYAGKIARFTGLDIRIVNTSRNVDIEVHVSDDGPFSEEDADLLRSQPYDLRWAEDTVCFFISGLLDWEVGRGIIIIDKGLPQGASQSCLLHELYQMIGPIKNSSALRYSISHGYDRLTRLSLNDKLILRALYDDRLKPGMPREEAMRVARTVITELVAAVKRDGHDALIHPRHRARMAGNGAGR